MLQAKRRHLNGLMPDMMKSRSQKKKTTEDEKKTEFETYLKKLSHFATAPKTFRMPEIMVFRLERLARELDTTAGRLIIELLYEILPRFEQREAKVRLRTIEIYDENAAEDALARVDLEKLFIEVRQASNFARRPPGPEIQAEED